ncbi:pyridoxamine 5'-phosphate oxidase family protein [Garicola koreensis]|uniref:pyridoxamine 5'-phosphate oxidase family protein n=1 Tax=Garicola koreensis TaxID=1262554 RepID=UPI0031F1568E
MMFDHPHDEPILMLTEEQCWQLLERIQHGRLVGVVDGRADIFPVNVAAQDRTLVFRTAPGTKLAEVTVNENVLFETDGILPDQAWSVVVRGTAEQLQTSAERAEAEKLELRPWVPTLKDHFVRITPTEVSGRHFRFGEHPERELGEGSEVG